MEQLSCNKENEANCDNICTGERKEKERDTSFIRKVSFIRESVSDSRVPERKFSGAPDSKRSSVPSQETEVEHGQALSSPKVPKKFISTWRQACDRTKDRTKELLKRWRTLPEGNAEMMAAGASQLQPQTNTDNPHNWSVHVWASYIKRYPSEDENLMSFDENAPSTLNLLSSTQKEKMSHFFSHLLDSDQDDLISEQDFDNFSEKLRRYADWSTNSPQFLIMVQVQQGFLDTFLPTDPEIEGDDVSESWKRYVSLEEWLSTWGMLVSKATNLNDFPLWLHYLPKILFQAINKSGSGIISRDELGSFYSSILGYTTQRVGEILDEAFNSLTSNGDHPISYSVYRLVFTNFLLGRYPNGPGQYLFGCVTKKPDCFPIDYSALNCQPEDREHYTPDKKSNRVSIVV
ncbi:uncharacterized protein LOC128985871 [Macrosteles quadrilineatus]|uniref:uncharacterized protein LOC128985871 n=1 Tax=Macrosteles quadrilineatus TaxID=74068 RepID=UPI0023E314B4|nr:uncharacterized protein LOC128985871 [Macrosteles quadrilineatus]